MQIENRENCRGGKYADRKIRQFFSGKICKRKTKKIVYGVKYADGNLRQLFSGEICRQKTETFVK